MPTRDTAPVGAPCWIDLSSSDTDRSRAFYGELFGWASEQAGPEYGGYINFLHDGAPIAGCMAAQPQFGMAEGWSVYLATDDVAKAAEGTTAAGGQVAMPPVEVPGLGHMAFVVDPGGATVGLWQPIAHQGFRTYGEPGTPGWFELLTRDHDASVAFYRQVLGWDTHVAGDTDEFRYTTLGEGDAALAGVMDASRFLPEGEPAHWSVYFSVADADATIAAATRLGATLLQGPEDTPYGRLAALADPLGARFKLVQ